VTDNAMRRTLPLLKRIATGTKHETPFFFNYEDMEVAWEHMRSRSQKSKAVPEKPVDVEVFNLWDVLTSMDRDDWKKRQQKRKWIKQPLGAIKDRLPSSGPPGWNPLRLFHRAGTRYKEAITARGNGKARHVYALELYVDFSSVYNVKIYCICLSYCVSIVDGLLRKSTIKSASSTGYHLIRYLCIPFGTKE
jgi:hypothetical protein